jgi:serine/threonine protein kinase
LGITFEGRVIMADDLNDGRLQRKRRKLARKDEALEVQQVECAGQKGTSSPPAYNFLHLASLILEHDLPILFPGSERPRNAYGMIGAGGSFLVFKEERSMNDVTVGPDQIRSLEDKMVLKRTRQHDDRRYARINSSTSRYLSIMSELQILLDPAVQAHENIIDLHGLTWDFEPEDDDSYSVWPVMGLEAAECSMRSLMDEYNDSEAPLSTRVGYCYNVAVALEFLHARGVAHCDVKLENVLACVTQRSGSVGKLSDFGSALLGVNEDTFIPNGVAGTPPWNAPEYRRPLRGVEIFKVDVYSFGMLLWRFVARSPTLEPLENAGVKEKESLIQNLEELKLSDRLACIAEEEVRHSYENSDELNSVIEVLTKTLVRQAEERCSMTYVCSLLASVISPAPDSDAKVENYAESQSQPEDSPTEDIHSGEDYAEKDEDNASTESVYQILPIPFEPFYNDVGCFLEYDCAVSNHNSSRDSMK